MARDFDVIIEQDEDGWYVGSAVGLSGCHTQARSLDELLVRMREVIELCLEVDEVPSESIRFVGVRRVTVPG